MMLLLFLLMLLAVILAWIGQRRSVFICLGITLIFAAIFFYSDITTHLTIDL